MRAAEIEVSARWAATEARVVPSNASTSGIAGHSNPSWGVSGGWENLEGELVLRNSTSGKDLHLRRAGPRSARKKRCALSALLTVAAVLATLAIGGRAALYMYPSAMQAPTTLAAEGVGHPKDTPSPRKKGKKDLGVSPRSPPQMVNLWDPAHLALGSFFSFSASYEDFFEAKKCFRDAATDLVESWNAMPTASRKAFAQYYMLPVDGEAPADPLAFFQQQIDEAWKIDVSVNASDEEIRTAAGSLLFATGLLNAARYRLEGLTDLEQSVTKSECGSWWLGIRSVPLRPPPEGAEGLMDFPAFAKMLDSRYEDSLKAKDAQQNRLLVPSALATRLYDTMTVASWERVYGDLARQAFDTQANATVLTRNVDLKDLAETIIKGRLKREPQAGGRDPLFMALSAFENRQRIAYPSKEEVSSWARDWSAHSVRQKIEELKISEFQWFQREQAFRRQIWDIVSGNQADFSAGDYFFLQMLLLL